MGFGYWKGRIWFLISVPPSPSLHDLSFSTALLGNCKHKTMPSSWSRLLHPGERFRNRICDIVQWIGGGSVGRLGHWQRCHDTKRKCYGQQGINAAARLSIQPFFGLDPHRQSRWLDVTGHDKSKLSITPRSNHRVIHSRVPHRYVWKYRSLFSPARVANNLLRTYECHSSQGTQWSNQFVDIPAKSSGSTRVCLSLQPSGKLSGQRVVAQFYQRLHQSPHTSQGLWTDKN